MPEHDVPKGSAAKPRLLFVEDEATLRDHLAERLSDEYIVDTAGNGNEALLAVLRAKPALVVTDIVMPDMDGVELLQTLRQTPGTRSIPVLLISGRAADDHRIEGFEKGADGFLPKPYTERELRALIGSMLRAAQLRTEVANRAAREQAEQHRKQLEAELKDALAELHGREAQLREIQLQLAAEVDSVRRLHELVSRLLGCHDPQMALEEVLDAAISLLEADMGDVQLRDPQTGALQIVAQRGFPDDLRERLRNVDADPNSVAAAAGCRAVQSTPVTSRNGELLGVLSTRFRNPHRPSEGALRMIDLYARQAAEFLERVKLEASLKEARSPPRPGPG